MSSLMGWIVTAHVASVKTKWHVTHIQDIVWTAAQKDGWQNFAIWVSVGSFKSIQYNLFIKNFRDIQSALKRQIFLRRCTYCKETIHTAGKKHISDFPKVTKKCQTLGLTRHKNLSDRKKICRTETDGTKTK